MPFNTYYELKDRQKRLEKKQKPALFLYKQYRGHPEGFIVASFYKLKYIASDHHNNSNNNDSNNDKLSST